MCVCVCRVGWGGGGGGGGGGGRGLLHWLMAASTIMHAATLTNGSLSEDEVGGGELDVCSSMHLREELEGLQCSWDGQGMLPLMEKPPTLLEGHLNDVCLGGRRACATIPHDRRTGGARMATQI